MTKGALAHAMGFVGAAADRAALLDHGSLVDVIKLEDLFEHPKEEHTNEFLGQIPH